MRGLAALPGALLALVGGLACEDLSYKDIGAQINAIATRDDVLVPPAHKRLVSYGRGAIPQIETALHGASVRGKLNLLAALDAIGDDEAIPILRHFAVYDFNADVRVKCEAILKGWAARQNTRGDRARTALARVADKRAAKE